MSQFVFEFLRTSAGQAPEASADHRRWCLDLHGDGRLGLAGAYTDGSGFLVILQGLDRLEGERLVRDHPWVVAGSGSWSLREWSPDPSPDQS
ncbi:MAG: hypothetical protein OEV00_02165 [Acidobacteriota bacterium]|nr:hypothetical protein [Acidobacteriota bacterium]MDH3784113.1 hypothetical protein [Acidobacteriota bacterium]